jgi:hypothetical protein
MSVDLVVDLVIIIWGSLILIALIAAIILGFILYRKVKTLTNSIKETVEIAKQTSSEVGRALKSSKSIFSASKSEKAPSCEPAANSNTRNRPVN